MLPLLGAAAGSFLPEAAVVIVSGIAFLAVAAWTLRGKDEADTEDDAPSGRRLAGMALILTVATTFIASEMGDKTMLATFALAAQQGGAADLDRVDRRRGRGEPVAVVVGRQAGHRLSPRLLRIGSAALFAVGRRGDPGRRPPRRGRVTC